MAANDTVVLTMAADGDAQFTVQVNGAQVLSSDVTAQHGTGDTQQFTVTGDFSNGGNPTNVAVNFLNAADGPDLYVEAINFDGTVIQGNQAVLTWQTANPNLNPGADPNAAVMFNDGTATFTVGRTAPVVSTPVAEETVGPNQTVALSSLFSANEAVTQYNVYEGSFANPVGTITDTNGNTLATFQNDPVTSLDGLTYNSSDTAGTDRLWVQAFADGQWSQWALVQMTNTGSPPDTGSSNTPITFNMSADGDAQFIVDVNGQQVGGVFDVTAQHDPNSTTPANTQNITVNADLAAGANQITVQFLNATANGGNDLYIESMTVNGQTIKGNQAALTWDEADPNVNPNADPNAAVMFSNGEATFAVGGEAPTVSTSMSQDTVGPGQTVALSDLFSANEPDHDPITQYNVYEGSFANPVGTVTDANGNTIATFQNDTVSSLDGMTYNSSDTAGTDRLWVQAFADGQWSQWALVQMVNTGGTPPVTTGSVSEETVGPNQTVALSDLFSTNEPVTQYNVYEGSFNQPVGTLTDANGNTITPFANDTVTSLDGITYQSGSSAGTDRLWVQAFADGQWGNWALVQMANTGNANGSTVTFTMAADGDAQFTVDVNGQQVGGVFDVAAQHNPNGFSTTPVNTQNVTVTGDWGASGPSQVSVHFLNANDADLYIESVDVNGNVIQGNQAALTWDPGTTPNPNPGADPNAAVMFTDGTAAFNTTGSPPTSQLTQAMATMTSGSGGSSGSNGQVSDHTQTGLAVNHG